MSLIKSNNLIGLPVVTESGERLGSVRSFDVDVDSHTIVRYYVKPGSIVAIMGHGELLVHASQVVSITEKQMTVRDNTVVVPSPITAVGAV
ncbi:MAG: PRC-barrel domain-containing protein [bacterium]|nr:PRC-barrel domain-containing protein [bacterium]